MGSGKKKISYQELGYCQKVDLYEKRRRDCGGIYEKTQNPAHAVELQVKN